MSKLSELNYDFNKVVEIIETTKERSYRKLNEELIKMYFSIGEFISNEVRELKSDLLFIKKLAEFFERTYPELKGFDQRALYRMKQFYEFYCGSEEARVLLAKINWSCHLIIMSRCNLLEERIFYMNMCIDQNLSVRELERQIKSSYYERHKLSDVRSTSAIERSKELTKHIFLSNYSFEFLNLFSLNFSEKDLEKSILNNMKDFILEIGKDFMFIKEEYLVEAGGQEYYIDLLFYHRTLQCLVAFELKIGEFKPEYVGKMAFYLSVLDYKVKKENENPSVGVILCASKNNEIVEYALNKTLSPTMVAEYNLKLIDKKLLAKKLKEYVEIAKNNSKQNSG